MLKVGLTGGIASGKSTISRLFEARGISVYDADIISRQLMEPGQQGYEYSLAHFGPGILDDQARIDRLGLRQLVFSDPTQKKWLETMLHPLIRARCLALLERNAPGPYVMLVVPLMFETGFDQLVDHIICIDCPADVQRQRLVNRDRIDPGLADRMIASQMSNADRIQRADSVIDNGSERDIDAEVARIHDLLIHRAGQEK